MKTLLIAAATLAAALPAALPTPAEAQAWRSVNARQASQFARIEQGIRSGALTRAEATRLRTEFYALNRREQRYRTGGLSRWERTDLDRRFDALSRRIRTQKNDRQGQR